MTDFVRKVESAGVRRSTSSHDGSGSGPLVRLYCTASAHLGGDARYALQIFGSFLRADGSEGDEMYATASLSHADLVAVRAALDAEIAEIEERSRAHELCCATALRAPEDPTVDRSAPRAATAPAMGWSGACATPNVSGAIGLGPCAKCGAGRGDPCRTPAWRTRRPHQGRVRL